MEGNALQGLTIEQIDQWKKEAHERHVNSQAQKIYKKVQYMIDWQGDIVKSICLTANEFPMVYPENIKILQKNGFTVYKVVMRIKSEKQVVVEHHIVWGEDDFEKTYSKQFYGKDGRELDDYKLLEFRKL